MESANIFVLENYSGLSIIFVELFLHFVKFSVFRRYESSFFVVMNIYLHARIVCSAATCNIHY